MSAAPPDLRRLVYDLAKGRCAYCNVKLARGDGTIDHWMPKRLGGTNARENLRLCCAPCNQAKGSMHPACWTVLPGRRWHADDAAGERRALMLARIAPRYQPRPELAEQPAPDLTIDPETAFSRGLVWKPGSKRPRKP